jgi:hypothetical protein
MITALVVATGIALAPIPTDPMPDQTKYLHDIRGPSWGISGSDDDLIQLAMKTCVSLHPYGPNVLPTDALRNQVASILTANYHMPPDTAIAYTVLVQLDLCP